MFYEWLMWQVEVSLEIDERVFIFGTGRKEPVGIIKAFEEKSKSHTLIMEYETPPQRCKYSTKVKGE